MHETGGSAAASLRKLEANRLGVVKENHRSRWNYMIFSCAWTVSAVSSASGRDFREQARNKQSLEHLDKANVQDLG